LTNDSRQKFGTLKPPMSIPRKLIRRMKRLLSGLRHPSFFPILAYLASGKLAARVPDQQAITSSSEPQPLSPCSLLPGSGNASSIPARVFQTWKSRTDIPDNYRYWRSSFASQNVGFEIILSDDDDNRKFIVDYFPWFLPTYDFFPKEIFRADAVRPLFLFLYGGFYADMDSECLRSLEPMRKYGDVLLARMGADRDFEQSIPNALMASKPYELFWLLVVTMMMERADEARASMAASRPEIFTGPIILKDAVDFYLNSTEDSLRARCRDIVTNIPEKLRLHLHYGNLILLDPDVWYPVDWTNPFHRMLRGRILNSRRMLDRETACRLFPQAFMVTYWSHSWSPTAPNKDR
jgi:inositol phosphorylceramide mannosyltransferase catalytic subunit